MTAELQKLKDELNFRKTKRRLEIAQDLKQAEELGDLFRENFPYDAAVADQRHNETRISNIENAIKSLSENQTVKHEAQKLSSRVQTGSLVELEKEDGSIITLRLVDESVFKARIYQNAVTVESPLGKALINKKTNDIIQVHTTKNIYKINSILSVGFLI